MPISFTSLPQFRDPGPLDFSPLHAAFDDWAKSREKNRLLEEQKEIGASLQPGATGQAPASFTAQPVNRLLSPAQSSAAAAGRDYPAGPNATLDFIKQQEGYTPTAAWDRRQYSSGYGTRAAPGETITRDVAETRLRDSVSPINDWISKNVTVPLTDQQRAGLTSFAYNLGVDDLQKLLPDINAGAWDRVAARMPSFNKALGANGQLETVGGLTDRRNREAALVSGGAAPAARGPSAPSSGLNYAAGIQTALRQGNLSLAMQLQNAQQEAENTAYTRGRQATQDAQAAESHALTTQGQRDELQKNFVTRVASLAQNIASDPDPASRTAKWNRLVSADPRFAASLRQAGIDPSDVNAGTAALIAEARGLTGKKYEFTKYGVGDPSTGEIKPYPQGAGDASDQLERAKYEQQLRKEWSALTTETKTVNDSVARVRKGAELDSGSGDLAVVYGYMKLLDPGSVVREGEFATAEQTAGLPQQVVAIYNRIINGERLTPSQRSQFLTAAEGLAADKSQRFEATRRQFEDIARQAGSDPRRIMLDEGASSATPPANAGASAPKEAIDMLRQDPSPEAQREFDEIFGAGAAKRALGR